MSVPNQITWRERAKADHDSGKVPYMKVGVLRGEGKSLLPEPPKTAEQKAAQAQQTVSTPFPVGQPLNAAAVRQPAPMTLQPPIASPTPPVTETASIVAGPPQRRKRAI